MVVYDVSKNRNVSDGKFLPKMETLAKKRFILKVSCMICERDYAKLHIYISLDFLKLSLSFRLLYNVPLLWLNTWRTLTGIYENPQAKLFHTIQLNATMHQFSIIFINKCLMFSIHVQRMNYYEWTFFQAEKDKW